jgi:PAS domain S-box-containing protein
MGLHLTPLEARMLVASALLLLLLVAGMAVYLIHRIFKQSRETPDFNPKSPRAENETGFAMATMQAVITRMKEQERELNELRRLAEQRAKESARLSENVIREMPSGVLVFNREGFITTANPVVRGMLGVDIWSRRRYPEILGAESALAELIRACLESGKTLTRETVEYRTAQGETRVLGMSLSPFHGAGREIEGAVCLLTDLTETRRLQEQVRLKEHFAALGAMSAGIAHEFKNSLATISGFAQLLRDDQLPPEPRAHAEKIVLESRLLTQVVTDFLMISKPLAIAAQPVDIERLVRAVMDDLAHLEPFKQVDFRLEGEFVDVEGDEVLLRQTFTNLLRNSCEALSGEPKAGSVRVSAQCAREGETNFLAIRVEDTGVGIAPEDRDKIFLPFFTTKKNGTGLGLALVQKIVVAHNGRISLAASAAEGTEFSVLLPLHRPVAPSK